MPEDDFIREAAQALAGYFQGRTPEESKRLLAALERAGAAVYRSLAENEADPSVREGLLASAAREEENAEFLEAHPS
jgi:hypothetical protein